MKTVYDTNTREELIARIQTINQNNTSLWGKMNVFQIARHCTLCDDMMLGKIKIERVFIGRLIGKMILKKILKDAAPFGKNSPTSPLLITTTQNGDLELQKSEWISRIEQYNTDNLPMLIHPFFGPMTHQQIGMFVYKHTDHHLRQMGA